MHRAWAASAVVLLGCGYRSPSFDGPPPDTCVTDEAAAQGPLPGECSAISTQVTRVNVLSWQDGWVVTGLGSGDVDSSDVEHIVFAASLVTVRVTADGTIPDRHGTRDPLAVSSFGPWMGGMTAVVGPQIVITFGQDVMAVIPGSGQPARALTHSGPVNASALALDSRRIALAGRLMGGAAAPLGYMVLDVETGAELQFQEYPDLVGHSEAPAEFVPLFFGPTAALARLDSGRLLLAWVSADRRSIQARLIDDRGTPFTSAITLTTANTGLHLPYFAHIAPGRQGMVWTGDSGLEVRYRALNDDLSDGPSSGTIVNVVHDCSQDLARIAPLDSSDGALITWTTSPRQPLLGRFVGPDVEPTLAPPSANAELAPTCSRGVGYTAMATTESGTLVAYSDSGWAPAPATPLVQIVHARDFQ